MHTLWKTNPLWKQLKELWTGRLTIEQVLFIVFLREVQSQGLLLDQALPSLAEKYILSTEQNKEFSEQNIRELFPTNETVSLLFAWDKE